VSPKKYFYGLKPLILDIKYIKYNQNYQLEEIQENLHFKQSA